MIYGQCRSRPRPWEDEGVTLRRSRPCHLAPGFLKFGCRGSADRDVLKILGKFLDRQRSPGVCYGQIPGSMPLTNQCGVHKSGQILLPLVVLQEQQHEPDSVGVCGGHKPPQPVVAVAGKP
jgi:hypothetical protein